MKTKHVINTTEAPIAIGPYSQAIRAGNTVYISGQIPLDPKTGELIGATIELQAEQVFANLAAIAAAAGGSLQQIVKLTLYMVDLQDFAIVNTVMQQHFAEPYPARATVQVAALPKQALFEADAIMLLAE